MLLVHNEIHYIPIRDGWEEVLVHNVLHYVPVLHYLPAITHTTEKETSPPLLQQHTTTLHNSTQVHKTTNVPVVFMALIHNGFEGCNIITQGIGRGGP